jgi:adenine phosphoribosyltransferase|tara:strand:+ start:310 stop:825 length:516 start_codon:yes stop_codon:yes gene_type:complete
MKELEQYIRNIPDFPEPGIQFKDITPLIKEPKILKLSVKKLIAPFLNEKLTAIAGMEARGFIFGSLAAWELGISFIPLRKPHKLPYNVEALSYDLEYGSAALEIHVDALGKNDRVLLVDDLIATGGTAAASCKLIEKLGAKIMGCAFIIELDFLNGRDKLSKYHIHSLIHY